MFSIISMEPDNLGPPQNQTQIDHLGQIFFRNFEVYYTPLNIIWEVDPEAVERYKTLFPNEYQQLYWMDYLLRNMGNTERNLILSNDMTYRNIVAKRNFYEKSVKHFIQNTGGHQIDFGFGSKKRLRKRY